jgi:hypothetical protein
VNLRPDDANRAQIVAAAEKLRPMLDQIAFVGGCVTGLLLTDPAAAPVRPTLDVDAIVAIASYEEFTLLEDRLRDLGFHQSLAEDAPICRWLNGNLILDLIPTDPSILGSAISGMDPPWLMRKKMKIDEHEIQIVTAPYFLATKLEAFHGRGKKDFRSHDLEDIVTVIDGRPEIIEEVPLTAADLQKYLSAELKALLSNREFLEALPGHLLPDAASQQRLYLVMKRMQQLVRGK